MSDVVGRAQSFGLTSSGCIKCGVSVETFSGYGKAGTENARPQPGNITLCVACGHLQAINETADGFREVTEAERVRMEADPRVVNLRRAQRLVAAQGDGSLRSVEIIPASRRPVRRSAEPLMIAVHDACMAHFGLTRGDGHAFTEDQILDMAAAGATLTSAYLCALPYKRRLEIIADFIDKMLDTFKGKGPTDGQAHHDRPSKLR